MPELSAASLAALSAPGLDPVDVALPTLLNELTGVAERHVLVLDDYHVLKSPGIHEGVEFLLSYLPSSLQLVIAGASIPHCRWRGSERAATSRRSVRMTCVSPRTKRRRCSRPSPASKPRQSKACCTEPRGGP